jgi:hypothetical protein
MDASLGLIDEVAGLRTIVDRMVATGHVVGCGDGWAPIVAELDERLALVDPDYGLFRVGRDGGHLVYDAQPSSRRHREVFSALIGAAVFRAGQTCEVCGDAGVRREVGGLAEVLCPVHEWTADTAAASDADNQRAAEHHVPSLA